VVDNVEGAQKELLKYWSRVSGNRWLIAKMFGVLVCRLLCSSRPSDTDLVTPDDILPTLGVDRRVDEPCALFFSSLCTSCFFTVCGPVAIDYRMIDLSNMCSTILSRASSGSGEFGNYSILYDGRTVDDAIDRRRISCMLIQMSATVSET
jgi:hypothetical protein